MTKRQVMTTVLDGGHPPYVPWNFSFTKEAQDKIIAHYGSMGPALAGNHILALGTGLFEAVDVGDDCVRDPFGVIWDRSCDKDIGIVKGQVLSEPTLKGYAFPDPLDDPGFSGIKGLIEQDTDERYRVYHIGFSLFERAWSLRGMEALMIDFYENPAFARRLLGTIADFRIAQVREALRYDIDAVYFGDDWGSQRGLIMGPDLWREFIRPEMTRIFKEVRSAGKKVFLHSCGDVDELFDDLIGMGLNCFNPFQPEVMDVDSLLKRYRGRLAFQGGLSTQRILPFETPEAVRRETRRLLALGREGGYIFAPAHSVEGDVPVENIIAFIEEAQSQGR
jgi:uroporphyrinogen decarboxylase